MNLTYFQVPACEADRMLKEAVFSGEVRSEVRLADGRVLDTAKMKREALPAQGGEPGGSGTKIVHWQDEDPDLALEQEFVFSDAGTLTCRVTVLSKSPVSTRYMAALILPLEEKGLRFLSSPFDNDKWAKFVDYPAEYAEPAHEFTAIHPDGKANGLVIGSIDHTDWKSAVTLQKGTLTAYSGCADEQTRDLNGIPHGLLTGTRISSARFFVGFFDSYQKGFADFGDACAEVQPMLSWDGPAIFGWNSWSALMGSLTPESYAAASDFMAEIKNTYCGADGSQYINYDAMWQSFSNKVSGNLQTVRANGQRPGAYFCPFITHSSALGREVPGTEGRYFFEDLVLKDADGKMLPPVDGLISLDPTHPGTWQYMEYGLTQVAHFGFDFVKTDFVGHGCREGVFYKKEITTGVQAFRYGMQHFVDVIRAQDHPIFISLSIAPIFPYGYGHGRRISCDAFGTLDQTEYLNNCITYLWWMNDRLYRFNDPDHIVVYRTYDKPAITFNEGKSRYHSGVICGGLMISSDDAQIPEARERVRTIFSNEEINALARRGQSFVPARLVQGGNSSDVFVRKDGETLEAALFNYSISEEKSFDLDLGELEKAAEMAGCTEHSGKEAASVGNSGSAEPQKTDTGASRLQQTDGACRVHDCWTKKDVTVEDGRLTWTLKPAESAMLKITRAE
ncbi:MAG: hypothetical protein ACOX8B_05200 [Lachnospiraceae bacterium]|jgi:alpha-galactosidase